MSAPLTKKQQKALAFRTKQKAKRADLPEPEAVPEQDLDLDAETDDAVVAMEAGSSSKKRKRDDEVKGKGKGKKTAWDDDEDGDEADAGAKKKSKKEVKQRFILFVGNLDFKTTREDIQAHFKDSIGHLPAVRLLTTKATPKSPCKSRGIAFLELPSSSELQACLKLHQSSLKGRKLNVELTAGGGGKGDARKEKIRERNERVGGQREKKAEREKEEGTGGEEGREGSEAVKIGAEFVDERSRGLEEGKSKMRGGRRVKTKPSANSQASKPSSDGPLSGWANRTAAPKPPRGQSRRRFEPTGANAVVVG